MNLKESEEWYVGGFEGRKGKGGIISKIKEKLKEKIFCSVSEMTLHP